MLFGLLFYDIAYDASIPHAFQVRFILFSFVLISSLLTKVPPLIFTQRREASMRSVKRELMSVILLSLNCLSSGTALTDSGKQSVSFL